MKKERAFLTDRLYMMKDKEVKLWHIQWMIRSLLSPHHRVYMRERQEIR